MNSTTQHCKSSSLSDQAIQFRSAYGIQNNTDNRTMQLGLIDEEYQEFQDLMRRLDKMKHERDETLETIACLETIHEFFSEGARKR